ncbi:adenosylcobinamide-GDP ribazoletransferase [Clostridium sp. WILCCON 0269]|uniref:Adenosylcobinamide-GDP ribazoletransferase n=1 Tax=Candidatus Clostridium eludens TaxID=3381663 RepID=A0ABW8SFI2_9CLOT
MKKFLNDFLLMVQLLTRIPVNKNLICKKENFKRASIFMPFIGAIIGLIQWVTYKLCIIILPVNVSVSITIFIGIIFTGALHIDGLGDMCDGFFAFKDSCGIIEIMKDSRIGTYACLSIIMDILLKYSLFCFIVPKFSFIIIAAPVVARFSIVFIAFIGKPAKSTGSGNLFIGNIGKYELFLTAFITMVILLFLLNMNFVYVIILVVSALFMSFLINLFCNKKIGGLTGDLFGANNEIIEILTMIIVCVIITK